MPIHDHQPKEEKALMQSKRQLLAGYGRGGGAFQCKRVRRYRQRRDLMVRRAA